MMNQNLEKAFNRRELGKFVLPTVMMMMFMSLYTIVDGIFVSRLIGPSALSAINITLPVTNLIYGIAIMFATGASAVVAKNLGEGYIEKARARFSFVICIVTLIGGFLGLVGLVFLEPINRMLGASQVIMGYANAYLKVLLVFVPIMMVKALLDYFIVVAGRPNLGFGLGIIGGLTNMILDYVFIGPLQMGIAGAALATGIGQLIPTIIGILFFINKKQTLHFTRPEWDFKMLKLSMLNGSSEMVTNLASGVTTFLFNMSMMKYLGEEGVAAITVVLYAQFLLTAGYLGFTLGVAPIISFKYGNGDQEQLKAVIKYCYEFVTIASVCILILSYLIAPQVVGAFVDEGTVVYDIALNGFSLFAISFLFTGINIFASGMFTAFSNGKVSAIISFLRTFVFVVVLIMILPLVLEVNGIWLAIPIAEIMTLGIVVYYVRKYRNIYHY